MTSEKKLIDLVDFYAVLRRYLNAPHVRKSGPICCGMRVGIRRCIELLESQCPVDAVEVVHGKWIEHKWAEEENDLLVSNYECSVCHSWERNKSCYCPNCGAKMDVGREIV